jgi:hypothetical protein
VRPYRVPDDVDDEADRAADRAIQAAIADSRVRRVAQKRRRLWQVAAGVVLVSALAAALVLGGPEAQGLAIFFLVIGALFAVIVTLSDSSPPRWRRERKDDDTSA